MLSPAMVLVAGSMVSQLTRQEGVSVCVVRGVSTPFQHCHNGPAALWKYPRVQKISQVAERVFDALG